MRALLLVFWGLGPAAAAAQTFQEALTNAYQTNADLLGARATLRATDEQVGQARSGWLPSVRITSSTGQQNEVVSRRVYNQRINSAAGGLQLQQPLFDAGRTWSSVSQAESNVQASRADLLGTEQSVLLRAATTYQDVLRDRALLDLAREKEGLTRRQWEQIGIRFRAGQLTQPDVDQANSRYLRARVDTATQLGQLEDSAARFRSAVGLAPQRLTKPPRPPGLPPDVATARSLADSNSPVVIASAFRERAARAQIGVARADLLPSVGATLGATHDYGQTVPRNRTDSYGATVNLTIPLYQGGAAIGRLREVQENAERSRLDTLVSRRDAIENAARAFAAWSSTAAAARLATQQVQIAEAAYVGVQRQAALGARSTFELLGQLEEVYAARATLIGLEHDSAVAAYQLLATTGRFTAEILRLPVELYDPVPHYRKARSRGGLP